jgi:hypothetical protein
LEDFISFNLFLVIMYEIELMERILGHSYGEVPRILRNSVGNLYLNHIKRYGYSLASFISGLNVFLSRDCSYDRTTHTVFVPIGSNLGLFEEYAKYHELGHGYVGQRNKKFQELFDRLEGELRSCLRSGKISRELIEDVLVIKAVREGIADYLAINCQKLQVKEGREPSSVYCYEMEWMLVNFKCPEDEMVFTTSTPLSYEIGVRLEEMGKEIIENLMLANEGMGFGRIITVLKALGSFQKIIYTHTLGHYFIRTACRERVVDIGELIDREINDPPENLRQLQERVSLYMTSSTS